MLRMCMETAVNITYFQIYMSFELLLGFLICIFYEIRKNETVIHMTPNYYSSIVKMSSIKSETLLPVLEKNPLR